MAFVVVTWEPVLHLLSRDSQPAWVKRHVHTQTTVWTECGEVITGYIDEAEKHVVSCLACLVGSK